MSAMRGLLALLFVGVLLLSWGCAVNNDGPMEPPPGDDGDVGDGTGDDGTTEEWVRPNVGTLDPEGPEIAALRRGVEVMKSRPADDPTSWLYQANIHGSYDAPALEAWNTCQHGSYFFLSWHRMYLYYFERILRAASEDPTLALPFWDYTEPAQRAIPVPFRQPSGAGNALFVAERAPGINGGAQVPESATTFDRAMAFTNFTSPTGSGLSFGGQQVPGPVHFGGVFGAIESQPHNIIHVMVGGNTGWMSDPNLAARDPIFWLHHANIDRLWSVWIARGEGREDPTDDTWKTQTFVFFDETGQRVEMSGQEVVDTAAQLGYTYAPGSGDEISPEGVGESLPAAPFTDDEQEVLVERTVSARLSGRPSTVSLEVPAAEPQAVGEEGRLVLVLEGIRFGRPGVYFEVYAGAPEGGELDASHPSYVGNVAVFGQLGEGERSRGGGHALTEDATLAYDVTDQIERLRGESGWEGGLDLRFVPRGLEPAEDEAAAEAVADLGDVPEVRVERVKLVRE